MTGGKKIIEGLQDAVAHARASNSDLARLRALAEADAEVLFAALENPAPMTAAELEDEELYRQTVRSMTDPLDLARLRALAEAAEPGPWRAMPLEFDDWGMIRGGGFRVVAGARPGSLNADLDECRRRKIVPPGIKRNMAHIAAMDPPTTLALLDRLEAAEALIVELQAELQEQYEIIKRLQR
jgi:hypothetical protein